MNYTIHFEPGNVTVDVPSGTTLGEAARKAGFDLNQPCGGQGRCGRCAVLVDSERSAVRRRSTIRLSPEDLAAGYALACQTVVEGNCYVTVPPQETIERRLTTQKAAARVQVPFDYDPDRHQSVRRYFLRLDPPDYSDQTDDWSRIQRELARQGAEVLAVLPGDQVDRNFGAAIDIGTTTVTVWLVDLETGDVVAQAGDYNAQIGRGEDVISRIIYAKKPGQLEELQRLVVGTINRLIETSCKQVNARPEEIFKVTVAANPTMMHLLLAIPPEQIRLAPFIPAVNHTPTLYARDLGLVTHPQAVVDCLPGIASYVGADISAGVLQADMQNTSELTLFIDIGTNGETVLGNADWLVTCACSAGPAFEGAGVEHGMRATAGAIEEVWISSDTLEPTYRVIGRGAASGESEKPKGICGSGLLGLLAEMFVTGVLDKAANLQVGKSARIREGEHGPEYVVAWAGETATGQDIAITKVDIDNLMRAKAAIYAGFSVMAQSVGVDLADVSQMLIGGSFGQYINVEKAVQIGLLPDLPAPAGSASPWDRFKFLGNTSIRGAYRALLSREARTELTRVAGMMTYLELSADNSFYDAFTSALFLPHTDMTQFPTVEMALAERS